MSSIILNSLVLNDSDSTPFAIRKIFTSSFLFICKDEQSALTGLTLLDAVPSGYDFTYCQEWGLTINDAVLARTILDIRRKSYGSIESQLDLLYHDMDADKGDKTGEWYKAVKAVKTAIPK